ncbi:MAG TPA: DUF977 family protein [Candidatus Paceibacterota bacterium]|jgi:predicted HTH transcriptional regulator|nr:DUF977 family protein [Bacteriovoracaceae bacterium]HJN63035.1 DUF977 family protein [Candidatus Paceibacterota bacterium]
MNIFILIIVAIAGIALGMHFARGNRGGLIARQSKEKEENKEKIVEFLNRNKRATNNDIEKLLGVSDATATRYLNELENEGKVQQNGTTGRFVFYTLK